jgi:hypothetical protein
MNVLVALLCIHTPDFVKKRALRELFIATAAAFGCNAPPIDKLSYAECLRQFALFTQGEVEALIRNGGDVEAMQDRLCQQACQLGRRYARLLRIRTLEDMKVIGRILYRVLDIDFHSDPCGEVVISRCYFSCFYSSPVCRVMSAVDRGLFAGLSGGGQLVFSSRITEGQPCCMARFALQEEAR